MNTAWQLLFFWLLSLRTCHSRPNDQHISLRTGFTLDFLLDETLPFFFFIWAWDWHWGCQSRILHLESGWKSTHMSYWSRSLRSHNIPWDHFSQNIYIESCLLSMKQLYTIRVQMTFTKCKCFCTVLQYSNGRRLCAVGTTWAMSTLGYVHITA